MASSASRTCRACASTVEKTPTVAMPMLRHARIMRQATSPRLAIRTLRMIPIFILVGSYSTSLLHLEIGFHFFQGAFSYGSRVRFFIRHLGPRLVIPGGDKNGIPAETVAASWCQGNLACLSACKCLEGLPIIQAKLHLSQRRSLWVVIKQMTELICP